jgi:hypothetical protein
MATVFVGGSQRSGTTLVQTILCRSSGANPMVGEVKYLRQMVQAYAFGKRMFGSETNDYFDNPEELRRFHGGLLESFLAHARARFKSSHLVLKEPHLTMVFPELAELVPEARFVCVVRDPRDVIASMIEVGQKLAASGIKNEAMADTFARRNMREMCKHYLSFYLPALRSASAEFMARSLFLRYEDLAQAPEAALETLTKFTGLDLGGFDAAREDPGTGKVDFQSVNDYRKAWVTELYGKKISESRIGAFRKVLKPKEVAEIAQHCRGIMQRFRYGASGAPERQSA